jgi:hypothetical protein
MDDTDGFRLKMLFLAEMLGVRQYNVSLFGETREVQFRVITSQSLARVPETAQKRAENPIEAGFILWKTSRNGRSVVCWNGTLPIVVAMEQQDGGTFKGSESPACALPSARRI